MEEHACECMYVYMYVYAFYLFPEEYFMCSVMYFSDSFGVLFENVPENWKCCSSALFIAFC